MAFLSSPRPSTTTRGDSSTSLYSNNISSSSQAIDSEDYLTAGSLFKRGIKALELPASAGLPSAGGGVFKLRPPSPDPTSISFKSLRQSNTSKHDGTMTSTRKKSKSTVIYIRTPMNAATNKAKWTTGILKDDQPQQSTQQQQQSTKSNQAVTVPKIALEAGGGKSVEKRQTGKVATKDTSSSAGLGTFPFHQRLNKHLPRNMWDAAEANMPRVANNLLNPTVPPTLTRTQSRHGFSKDKSTSPSSRPSQTVASPPVVPPAWTSPSLSSHDLLSSLTSPPTPPGHSNGPLSSSSLTLAMTQLGAGLPLPGPDPAKKAWEKIKQILLSKPRTPPLSTSSKPPMSPTLSQSNVVSTSTLVVELDHGVSKGTKCEKGCERSSENKVRGASVSFASVASLKQDSADVSSSSDDDDGTTKWNSTKSKKKLGINMPAAMSRKDTSLARLSRDEIAAKLQQSLVDEKKAKKAARKQFLQQRAEIVALNHIMRVIEEARWAKKKALMTGTLPIMPSELKDLEDSLGVEAVQALLNNPLPSEKDNGANRRAGSGKSDDDNVAFKV